VDSPTTNDQDVASLRDSLASIYDDLLTYEEACEALGGISRYTLSRLVRDDKFRSVPIGTRRYIPLAALTAYVRSVKRGVQAEVDRYNAMDNDEEDDGARHKPPRGASRRTVVVA
jgi:excisionase family DNA binding protein